MEGSGLSYAEVLDAARCSLLLVGVSVKALKMRNAVTGAIVLELSADQKREKASAPATQLARVLDPNEVCVAALFRSAEARVVGIDISVTKDEVRDTLAKEGVRKADDVQLGLVHSARNGLASV
jgi:hypothetical protein